MTGTSRRSGLVAGIQSEGKPPKRVRLNGPPPKLSDVLCVLELGGTPDAYRPATRSISLSKLGDAALTSCPWSYPLRSLYETLGLAGEDAQGVQIHAEFDGASYTIADADADAWLNMLHEIWEQETDRLSELELRLTVSFPDAGRRRPEERLEAPREGYWFVEKAARTNDDWESCCRFMRHPSNQAGEGQGKVLLGTRVRLSKQEMLDAYRYIRHIAEGRLRGMVFSCHGSQSALKVQLAIMACIRLCRNSQHRDSTSQYTQAPGVDCPDNHLLGIECACQLDSLTRKLAMRIFKRPMVVIAQGGSLTALATIAGRFFIGETLTGAGLTLQPTILATLHGTTLRNATTGQDLGEIPALSARGIPRQTEPYGWDNLIIFMTPLQAMQWLVGEGDISNRYHRHASILPITHLYIHDWAHTPYFKPELILWALIGRDSLITPLKILSFSITTPVCTKHEQEAIQPVAKLCYVDVEVARTDELLWLVQQGITYRKAEPRERWWAPIRASERVMGRQSDLPIQDLTGLAERVRNLEAAGPNWDLDTLAVQHHTIHRGVAVELLRSAAILPPITDIWMAAWGHAWNMAPATSGLVMVNAVPPDFAASVASLHCCHLEAFGDLVRELRGRQTNPGYLLLLVPEAVLAMALAIWINERMADECTAVWTGAEYSGASQHMLDVVSRHLIAESLFATTVRPMMVIVASPGSINGYRHQLGHVNWVVCYGEPWRLSELNGVISNLREETWIGRRYDEIEIIWMSSCSDSIGLDLARVRRG